MRKAHKKSKHRQSFYSIEFGPAADTIRGRPDNILDYQDGNEHGDAQMSPKPMTPRRVKRRSVMTRGTNGRQSTTSRRSHSSSRSSVRHSRRKFQQNPVTKLMEQQQLQQSSSKQFASFSHNENPSLTATNLKSLNNDIIANATSKPNYKDFSRNINPDPIYYNTSVSTLQLQESWNSGSPSGHSPSTGHYNPTYQHSTPNLHHEGEHVDELYNNRPPSVRSSYSNFHGTRPLSSYQQTTENVFAGITSGQQQPQPQPAVYPQSQAPLSRRSASRESIRSMAFLNSGPPAYNLNYHTPPDSETTM